MGVQAFDGQEQTTHSGASSAINRANELDASGEQSDAPWDDELGLTDEMDSSDVFLSPEASVFFKGENSVEDSSESDDLSFSVEAAGDSNFEEETFGVAVEDIASFNPHGISETNRAASSARAEGFDDRGTTEVADLDDSDEELGAVNEQYDMATGDGDAGQLFESAIDFSEDSDDDGLCGLAAFVIDDGFNNADLVEQPNFDSAATTQRSDSMQRTKPSYALRLETMIRHVSSSKLYGFCR